MFSNALLHPQKFLQVTDLYISTQLKNKKIFFVEINAPMFSPLPTTFNIVELPLFKKSLTRQQLHFIRGHADRILFWDIYNDKNLTQKILFNIEFNNTFFYDLLWTLEGARTEILGSWTYRGAQKNISSLLAQTYSFLKIQQKKLPSSWIVLHGFRSQLYKNYNLPFGGIVYDPAILISQEYHILFRELLPPLMEHIHHQLNFMTTLIQMLRAFDLKPYSEDLSNPETQSPSVDSPTTQSSLTKKDTDTTPEETTMQQLETNSPSLKKTSSNDPQTQLPQDKSPVPQLAQSQQSPQSLWEKGLPYHIFTKKFDTIVSAKDLCPCVQERDKLNLQLQEYTEQYKATIRRLANKLKRHLRSRHVNDMIFDCEEGLLDGKKLSLLFSASNDERLIFKQDQPQTHHTSLITLLIDNSGSMRGKPIKTAALCSQIIAQALEQCKIPTEILGFTTSQWQGGKSFQLYKNQNSQNIGRLNDLCHIIYKDANMPIQKAKKNFGIMLKEDILKENIDGEALLWAADRMLKFPWKKRILIVISDGAPVDEMTQTHNPPIFLENHLRAVIHMLEKDTRFSLSAIGIGHDVQNFYKNAVKITTSDSLGDVLIEQLTTIL